MSNNSRTYLVTKELLKIYSKFTCSNLVNLYNLNQVYNTFGWYYDKEKTILFQVNLIIDSKELYTEKYNKEILDYFKLTSYTKLSFYLDNLKRNQICDKRNIFEYITIYEPGKTPEYFKMVDFNSEEIAISNKRKRQDTGSSSNDNIDWKLMVSASSTRNYFLNDPIIDWIKEYNIKSIHDLPSIKGNSESTPNEPIKKNDKWKRKSSTDVLTKGRINRTRGK